MTNHTADTLKFFLGMEVWLVFKDRSQGLYILSTHLLDRIHHDEVVNLRQVYPILKTIKNVDGHLFTVPSKISYSRTQGLVSLNSYWSKNNKGELDQLETYDIYELPLPIAMHLIKNGYGAIPDKSSPTGYVDFIHKLPCVTPKMVEEGGEV